MIKNHQLHEDHLPSKDLNIDAVNLALSQVVGGPVDSDEVLAQPMGFGDTRMDMTLEDVNHHVANAEKGIVEAATGKRILWFRKESFKNLDAMIKAGISQAKRSTWPGVADVIPASDFKGDVKFPDEILDLMLRDGVQTDDIDNGLIPKTGIYRVVSQSNPKRYYYVDKQGYNYFRYIGVDAALVGETENDSTTKGAVASRPEKLAAATRAMNDAEFLKQKPKKGKSGLLLYPAIIAGQQKWVTIPENESRQEQANLTESKIKMDLKFLDRLAGKSDGYGFFGHNVRDAGHYSRENRALVDVLDQAFLDAAKEAKFNALEIGVFGNSRDGRFLGDELTSLFDWAEEEPVQVLAIDKKVKNVAGLKRAAKDLALKYMKNAKWMANEKGDIDDEQQKWMEVLIDMGFSPEDVEF